MSHFLGRLIERARGNARTIEPLIVPRFAPNYSLGEQPAPEFGARLTSATQPLMASNEPIVRFEQQVAPAIQTETQREVLRERLLVPHFVARDDDNVTEEKKPALATIPVASQPQTEVRETAHVLLQNEPPGQTNARETPNDSSSNVHVTIGCIEVRAIQPAAPPRASRRQPAPPSLTLEAYLDARKKGGR